MIWTFDYNSVKAERSDITSEKEKLNFENALFYAKSRSQSQDDDDYVVITVEGYKCIAVVTNEFTPIEISPVVYPYDDTRVYPMQEVEVRSAFKVVRW